MTVKRVNILHLINHDDIPAGFLQERPPGRGILERINGDDGTVKAVERIMSGGKLSCRRAMPMESRCTSGMENLLHSSF